MTVCSSARKRCRLCTSVLRSKATVSLRRQAAHTSVKKRSASASSSAAVCRARQAASPSTFARGKKYSALITAVYPTTTSRAACSGVSVAPAVASALCSTRRNTMQTSASVAAHSEMPTDTTTSVFTL